MPRRPLQSSPFDPNRYIGSVTFVDPDSVRVNLPHAAFPASRQHAGYGVSGGQVGEFVFLEGDDYAILGRLLEVRLPDAERLTVEPTIGGSSAPHPIGVVQLLTSLELSTGKVISGIPQHPRVGERAFSAHPLLVKHVVEGNINEGSNTIRLATIPQESSTAVNVSPEQMFGRHCAVLGATGGGKSWTVARLVQESARLGGKIILIDATGEFHTYMDGVETVFLGGEKGGDDDDRTFVAFPYWELTEPDLFAIFQPSPGAQMPKLRDALTSLKLNHILHGQGEPHVFKKTGQERAPFYRQCVLNESQLEAPGARYSIRYLARQVFEECVHESGGTYAEPNHDVWGRHDEKVRGYCDTLMAKISSLYRSKTLRCLFQPEHFVSLTERLDQFFASNRAVMRISMEFLPFEYHARELLINALGRYLLTTARSGSFLKNPTVVVLDEAHQFLSKGVGDEHNRIELDAFGLIAKEGRKYGLTCVLATQRPRDIPEDVLSQIGMFVVHRLINERDRQIVEKACGSLDASAAAFLPTLGQGEAILVGVDFPMPTPVKITVPEKPPKSDGPAYAKYWMAAVN